MSALRGLAFILLLASVAYAGRSAAPPDVVEDALAYATTDRAKAIALLEEALATGPASADVDPIAVRTRP